MGSCAGTEALGSVPGLLQPWFGRGDSNWLEANSLVIKPSVMPVFGFLATRRAAPAFRLDQEGELAFARVNEPLAADDRLPQTRRC